MNFLDKLLNYYSLTKEEYEYMSRPLSEVALINAKKIKGIEKVTDRIFNAISSKEKIIIYGDYDCDGITATSILVKTFKKLNYEVSYYIPSRYIDGYGLNVTNVRKIKDAGFNLIIAVDNGIAAHEAIDEANKLGMDVIVVDHHEVPKDLPLVNAVGILHPIVSEISPYYESAGYLSAILSSALLGHYDPYLATLGGLSVISDLMELKGINRDVVRIAINNLKNDKYLQLMLLLDSPIISEKSFSMEIAPKINAIGRLIEDKNVNLIVKYLTSEDRDEIIRYHSWINNINLERKELTKEVVESLPKEECESDGIVLKLDVKEGLIGLIANRLLGEYNKPTIIFTSDSNDSSILKGSIRSKEGFNVTKAFASLDKYLLTGGGHALAGGLSIKASDFEAFKADFNALAKEYKIIEVVEESIPLELNEINTENYKIYRSLAPYGMGFKEPLFKINHLPTRSLTFISEGKHLSTPLTIKTKLLGFNMSEVEIKSIRYINLYGNLNLSSFNNKETIEFRIIKYEESIN